MNLKFLSYLKSHFLKYLRASNPGKLYALKLQSQSFEMVFTIRVLAKPGTPIAERVHLRNRN
ncbi:MAG: hypothetical protein CM15mP58_18740 [Burkholderiaceae bacterium]|nr:MAG: hypothetical protein CM15mP58_18740 [Burkholderiaceae bacterium]